jgi:hypothetical protein
MQEVMRPTYTYVLMTSQQTDLYPSFPLAHFYVFPLTEMPAELTQCKKLPV